jgi:hypothetical protein
MGIALFSRDDLIHPRYYQLETFLKNSQWREADEETARLMLQIAGKEADQILEADDIKTFPSEDLKTMDRLWIDYSSGKFGFSIQKQIWLNSGGIPEKYDDDVYKKFATQVGWRKNEKWLTYDEIIFDLENSQLGHLPKISGVWTGLFEINLRQQRRIFLMSRTDLINPGFSQHYQLEIYLKNEQWRKADEETERLMLHIMGKKFSPNDWLNEEDIKNFPSNDLQTIDKLWIDYSKGKFGFSVQKQIWLDCGGIPGGQNTNQEAFPEFAEEVGWRVGENSYLFYNDLNFDLSTSKRAHLPGLLVSISTKITWSLRPMLIRNLDFGLFSRNDL